MRLLACPNWLNLKNGGKDAILNVSDDAISEIIFGVGTPENVKNEVKNLVAKPDSKCRNAKLYQLEMRTDRYGFRKTDV